MTAWIPLVVVLPAALVAAATDLRKFRVYNALTIPLFFSGIAYHTIINGWSGLGHSLGGAAFGFAVLIFPHALGLMGAGDVKLLAGIGAWMGFPATAAIFIIASLCDGVLATMLILIRGELRKSWQTIKAICLSFATLGSKSAKEDMVQHLINSSQRRYRLIPYGAVIAAGVLGSIAWTQMGV